MPSLLDRFLASPLLWLGTYACGSVMTIVATNHALGEQTAGYAAGFLILAGTIGYEALTRRIKDDDVAKKISTLEHTQSSFSDEIIGALDDIGTIKEEVAKLGKNQSQLLAATTKNAASNAPRPKMRPATFMPQEKPANQKMPSAQNLRAQRYKDILTTKIDDESDTVSDESHDYSDAVVVELLHQAIQNNKIEIFAQPIVKLPSRHAMFLELFVRIRAKSGVYLSAEKYRKLAEKETVLKDIDHLLLLHAIDAIRSDDRRGQSLGYFINVAAKSLTDTLFMGDLLEFVRSNRDLCRRMVFEFQYNDFIQLNPAQQKIIDGLTHLGCFISVDNVGDLHINADALAESGVNFLKFDAKKLVELCNSDEGAMQVARMKSSIDRAGIQLIVEKIENNFALKELLDFEIDYGEGFLFGKPDVEVAYRRKRKVAA